MDHTGITAAALLAGAVRADREDPGGADGAADCALLGAELERAGLLPAGSAPAGVRTLLAACRGRRAAGPYRLGDLVWLRPKGGGERAGLVERDHGLDVTVVQSGGRRTWPKGAVAGAVRPVWAPEEDPMEELLSACLSRWLAGGEGTKGKRRGGERT